MWTHSDRGLSKNISLFTRFSLRIFVGLSLNFWPIWIIFGPVHGWCVRWYSVRCWCRSADTGVCWILPPGQVSGDSDAVPLSTSSLYNIWLLPYTRTPALGVKNLQFWYTSPWSYTLSLHGPRPGVETMIFKEIHQFYTFPPKLLPLGRGGGG